MANLNSAQNPPLGEWLPKLTRYTAMAGAGLAATASQAGIVVWTPSADNVAAAPSRPGTGTVYFDFESGQVSNSNFSGADFFLTAVAWSYTGTNPWFSNYASVIPLGGNRIQQSNSYPAKLVFGAPINAAQSFQAWQTLAGVWSTTGGPYSTWGNWLVGGQGYLGLEFDIGGNTHYGWADITVENTYPPEGLPSITLSRFAYNTEAGQEILAGQVPEPASMVPMALLALGAAGFARYRQRHTSAKN